jgi:hypothetical protein
MPNSPVFIIGSPRSGTSVLVDALHALGYEGFREGNFLSLIDTLSRTVDIHFATFAGDKNEQILVSQVDRDELKADICLLLKREADRFNVSPLWFDKTGNPEMIRAVPMLRSMWPRARFIFAKRRAIENVSSRIKKFPQHGFEYHCSDWARNMSTWREIRKQIPEDTYVEIDQQELLREPDVCAERIIGIAGLRFASKDALMSVFEKSRAQESEEGSARAVFSLEEMPWTEPQMLAFRKHCIPEMDAFGYSTGQEYWKAEAVAPA